MDGGYSIQFDGWKEHKISSRENRICRPYVRQGEKHVKIYVYK
jgi:hypothetical protein